MGVVGVGSAFGSHPRPQLRRARRGVNACKKLVYSCFYIVAIGATRLQEVSYILAKISDVDRAAISASVATKTESECT